VGTYNRNKKAGIPTTTGIPATIQADYRGNVGLGEIVVVYAPGGCREFYEELGPATRLRTPDPGHIAEIFARHDMSLLGPPLTAD
jgi:hypothetical protein